MTRSLVLELQDLAADESTPIATLLRRALSVSRKLQLDDISDWINSEMSGYDSWESVPTYRKTRASLRARNPYHGLIPFMIGNEAVMDKLTSVSCIQSIGELEDVLQRTESSNTLTVPFDTKSLQYLYDVQQQDSWGTPLEPVRIVSPSHIAAILDAVRNRILEFALDLEQRGILGEDQTFSKEEKAVAQNTQTINVQNMQGIIGNVNESTVSQSVSITVQKGDLDSLDKALRELGIEPSDIDQLKKALHAEPSPPASGNFGPKVAKWLGIMVTRAASGGLKIAAGAASSVLAAAINRYYGLG